jgi:Spy/CpxP family protein refolding chaperone
MMLPRSLKHFAPIALFAGLALGGCVPMDPPTDDGDEASYSLEVAAADPAEERGARGHEGKFGRPRGHMLLGAALHELDLSDAQRATIKGAMDSLGGKDEEGMRGSMKALAEGVRRGQIDDAVVNAKLAARESQASARREATVKALETLHATLTPSQREALVASVEARMKEGPRFHGPKGERGAREHGKHGMGFGPAGHLLRGLDLREEQRAAIASALSASRPEKPGADEMQAKRERFEAALQSFRAETFDAAAALPDRAMEPPVTHLVTALKAIVPVLDEAQRAELATRLEEGPRSMGGHGRGKRGEARAEQAE